MIFLKSSPRDLCWDLSVTGRWLCSSHRFTQSLGRWHGAGWDKQASASIGHRTNHGLPCGSAVAHKGYGGRSLRKCSHGESRRAWRPVPSPEPEWWPSAEENGLWFGLGLFKESKKGMMLHTDFPEGLAEVSTGHQEFQGVLVGALQKTSTAFIFPALLICVVLTQKKATEMNLSNKIVTVCLINDWVEYAHSQWRGRGTFQPPSL